MEIRDLRNGDWHWVNNAVTACVHITHAEKCVYSALATFGGCKEIRPSFETIAERSNVTARYAKSAVKRLIEAGYVLIVKGGGRGKTNLYDLLKTPKGCKFCTVSKECEKQQETVIKKAINSDNLSPQLYKELNKEINNTLSTIKGKTPNGDINYLIEKMKEIFGLPALDGSQESNRRYCWLALKKFKTREMVEGVMMAAIQDPFWRTKITDFKTLYYNGVKIASTQRKSNVVKIR